MMKKTLQTLGLSGLAALFLLGCGGQQAQEPVKAPAENQAEQSAPLPAPQKGEISLEEAKTIALGHAGVAEADVIFDDMDYEQEDGRPIYEISFDVGTTEYEYDIDALTGEILKSEIDH